MALTADQILPDASGANKTFVLLQSKGQRVERLRSDSSIAVPKLFVIDHTTTKTKGGVTVDRHLIQCSIAELLASGEVTTSVVNLTVAIPRNAVSGNGGALDALCHIANFVNASATVTLEPAMTSVLAGFS